MDRLRTLSPSPTPSLAHSHSRSLSRSLSRSRPRITDDLLSDLSPTTTFEAFTSPAPSRLKNSIEAATQLERAFGIRASFASKKIKEWMLELSNWPWPAGRGSKGFETPEAKRRKLSHESEEDTFSGSDDDKYIGSLLASQVLEYELRLEEIATDMDDLKVDEIKREVLANTTHLTSPRLSSASFQQDDIAEREKQHFISSGNYTAMDDFTAIITATVLRALPNLSRLTRLMDVWSVRLTILRRIPALLDSLDDAELALASAWKTIETAKQRSLQEDRTDFVPFNRQSFNTLRYILQDKVTTLGQTLDFMLDTLEGWDDTLPDGWLDRMERIENTYGEWAAAADRTLREEEWRMQRHVEMERQKQEEEARKREEERIAETNRKAEEARQEEARKLENERIIENVQPAEVKAVEAKNRVDSEAAVTEKFGRPQVLSDLEIEPDLTGSSGSEISSPNSDTPASENGSAIATAPDSMEYPWNNETNFDPEPNQGLPSISKEPEIDEHSSSSQLALKDQPTAGKGDFEKASPTQSISRQSTENVDKTEFRTTHLGDFHFKANSPYNGTIHSPRQSSVSPRSLMTPAQIHEMSPKLSDRGSASSNASTVIISRPANMRVARRLTDNSHSPMSDRLADGASPVIGQQSPLAGRLGTRVLVSQDYTPPGSPHVPAIHPRTHLHVSQDNSRPESPESPNTSESSFELPLLPNVDVSNVTDLPSPTRASADQMQQQISEILQSLPARIRLTSEPDTNQHDTIQQKKTRPALIPRQRSHSSMSTVRSYSSMSNTRSSTPSFTLRPAYSRESRPRAQSGVSETRLYHLSRTAGETPIKLFVRLVGENGERVMVRVGGGWADFGEYLKEYAAHHRRRSSTTDDKVEIQDIPPRHVSSGSAMSTSTVRNGRASPASRPTSALERPTSSLAVRKTRRSEADVTRETRTPRTPSTPMPFNTRREKSFSTPPSAVSTASSSKLSWSEEDSSLGLAGPKSKKVDISPRDKEWVESMKDKVRKASAEKEKEKRSASDFGVIGKVGGTKRLFRRG
ncbi:hypothetical protein F5884DRAFT_658949 [Xylogone sp. PMI_703]|nr:hypothetical protein F5884DRAFT_658949 [Xylogone sp. PMI_703]